MPPPLPLPLLLLLVGGVLLRLANGGPPPVTLTAPRTVGADGESSPPPATAAAETVGAGPASAAAPTVVTRDMVIDELFRNFRHMTRDAVTEPLAELAKTLADIQTAVAAVFGRLLSIEEVQLQQQTAQADLTNRLDTLLQQQQQQQQRQQQQEQQQQEEEEASVNGRTAVQKHLVAIQDAISHITKMPLGRACGSDTDCSRLVPDTVCNRDGMCSCRSGFRWAASITCERLPLLTEPCEDDANCQAQVPNAVCASGACDCPDGYWSHGNTECRQVSAVALGGSCIGDQDCKSASHQECNSGTCSCITKTIGDYELRLAGRTCTEGNVELRRTGSAWGLVCDDDWGANDGKVICRSLGLRYEAVTIKSYYGRGTNFYMDNVGCDGSETSLLHCAYLGWGKHNCGDGEVAGVRCST